MVSLYGAEYAYTTGVPDIKLNFGFCLVFSFPCGVLCLAMTLSVCFLLCNFLRKNQQTKNTNSENT